MDILKEFKDYLLHGGIHKLIDEFRNPKGDIYIALEAKYIPALDARYIKYFNEVRQEDIETYSYFKDHLKKELSKIKIQIAERITDLNKIKNNDPDFYANVRDRAGTIFYDTRRAVDSIPSYKPYSHEILLFITEVEALYTQLFSKVSSKSNVPTSNRGEGIVGEVKLTFGYLGDMHFLKALYHLTLDRGDFIDRDNTTEGDFIEVLTSSDIFQEKGKIRFGCETLQAAYIIGKMQGRFSNFTLKSIEQCGKFYSQKNTLLTANTL